MKLFDTHCHFETADTAEIAAILSRAKAAGVEKLLAVGGSQALNAGVAAAMDANGKWRMGNGECRRDSQASFPDIVGAIGFDRDQVGMTEGEIADALSSQFSIHDFKSLGEIGLDYHYSPETRKAQTALFAAQLEEARRRDLPVVIHTREAADDTIAILKEIPSRGVIHCFTGEPAEARAYLDLGFYISISGIVTFRAADNVRESALVVPDDRILIETDSPFLAPVPMRGKTNEPAFVAHTCEFLAKLRGMAADDFAGLTFANAERLFA